MPFDTNLRNTCIFLVVFILAFFPAGFQYLLKPILWPFSIFSSDLIATSQIPRACNCCPTSCATSTNIVATQTSTSEMSWFQRQFTLPAQKKGSYLITDQVLSAVPEIRNYKTGLLHLFIQHTSCGLSLNENFDSDVRADMTDAMDRLAPEDREGKLYRHADEGLDDMPAHIKSMLVGASVSVPITDGKLNTGTWQGIWYLEFRSAKQARRVVATIQGEKK
jgi:secondary thiamine-phosphate synthase enzyme